MKKYLFLIAIIFLPSFSFAENVATCSICLKIPDPAQFGAKPDASQEKEENVVNYAIEYAKNMTTQREEKIQEEIKIIVETIVAK